ncbi:7TM diverse intracellular signaling domain-containing protein [Aliarcobacter butzleri]|uniref:7TM diverse intracellular signaling domain-containing protein n=1 Tax=Aliarcobacter butzleri TaxID=28197 RepID=UPI00263E80D4|nr:7TM diverse intracellular signaling domain-containing protein [Aliarcobacter butzleri]MDN5049250.1 ATP-binding protein [Aliarcobacter butzleri]MDN5055760.1 ATP-binding protein [Aliarcobacter butzleri]
MIDSIYKVVLFIIFSSNIYANILNIDENTKNINLLQYSEIYIDKTRSLTIEDIKNSNIKFEKNDKNILAYGYSPDLDVWIKITIKNNSNKSILKIIEYNNPLTTNIDFFDSNKNIHLKDGFLIDNLDKSTINPIFKIELDPNEENIYFIKATSNITTLIVDLKLWDENVFYKKEIKHQLILSLFFGAMFILGIYNLFIYVFTKDKSYLYYVLYIFGLILHHLVYVGFAKLYIFNLETLKIIIELAALFVALPIYFLGFFTKSFLQTIKYPKLNKILNIFLIIIPLSIIFFLLTEEYDKYRTNLLMLFLIFLMIVTIYASLNKNRQAYFILFAWFVFLSSGLLMTLSSMGIYNTLPFPYLIEVSFVLEAVIFSIALANRITNLQKEKNEANQKLIVQQENETKRLSKEVDLRTKDLKVALGEKEVLLKELNHRVKNNMQTIVSLIRLQSDEIEDEKLKDILLTTQNRIAAMGHLHELLYNQENINFIDVYEYFETLVDEVKSSYDESINIYLDIKTKLKMEQAIYCGLMINELITNSFKYAFLNKKGNIYIILEKSNNILKLSVKDDGIGFDKNNTTFSLGLTLVNTLAINQLKGEMDIKSKNGTSITISWNENE